jgi:hypothetical protein
MGADIWQPHTCPCGTLIDATGAYALSCRRIASRLIRHNHLNDVIHRALSRADIPSSKEPAGLLRTDGKRPDSPTFVPWRESRCLVCDVTVADTTATSYLVSTAVLAGSVADLAIREMTVSRDFTEK